MVKPIVIWDEVAAFQLKECYNYIAKESISSAKKVRDAILNSTNELIEFPEKHPIDRFKTNNDSSYRAFELYNFRVSYRITTKEIRILRIRHTSRNPLVY